MLERWNILKSNNRLCVCVCVCVLSHRGWHFCLICHKKTKAKLNFMTWKILVQVKNMYATHFFLSCLPLNGLSFFFLFFSSLLPTLKFILLILLHYILKKQKEKLSVTTYHFLLIPHNILDQLSLAQIGN